MVTTTPALATSFVQFEAFPMQAVKAVDPASTAYAHRQDDILVFVFHLLFLLLQPLNQAYCMYDLLTRFRSLQGVFYAVPPVRIERCRS